MRPKIDFDRDWPAQSRRWLWPIRSIRRLMVVVAASGILLAAVLATVHKPRSSTIGGPRVVPIATAVRPQLDLALHEALLAELQQRAVTEAQPRDPLVVNAPESIDPRMVVRAPASIDPQMVIVWRGDAQPEEVESPAPARGVLEVSPESGLKYIPVPTPDGSSPSAEGPRYRLVPVPDRSIPSGKTLPKSPDPTRRR